MASSQPKGRRGSNSDTRPTNRSWPGAPRGPSAHGHDPWAPTITAQGLLLSVEARHKSLSSSRAQSPGRNPDEMKNSSFCSRCPGESRDPCLCFLELLQQLQHLASAHRLVRWEGWTPAFRRGSGVDWLPKDSCPTSTRGPRTGSGPSRRVLIGRSRNFPHSC